MVIFGYIRVSTFEQAEKGYSISEQKHSLQMYADIMESEIEFFIDDGASAKDMNRKELQRMIKRVKNKDDSGIVVTTKLDRLSRKLTDILYLIDFFKTYGFTYVSKAENIDTVSSSGRLFTSMMGSVAEFERQRISERVRENMIMMVKTTNKAVSRPPYGYEVIDGYYSIKKDEAEVLKMMFDWALNGDASAKIAKKLNAAGIPSKTGIAWGQRAVKVLLANESLTGIYIHNKTRREGTITFKRPESEWVINENHHEAIISLETFSVVQALAKSRKRICRRSSEDTYLLSGLVKCGYCGYSMCGKKYGTKKKENGEELHTYYKYVCTGYSKMGICKHKGVKRDELEAFVLERINDISNMNPQDITLQLVEQESTKIDIAEIAAKLEKINARVQKQLRAYEEDLISADDLKIASDLAKNERKQLNALYEEASKKEEEEQKITFMKRVKSLFNDINSDNRVLSKQSIRQVIKRITVDGNGVTIDLYNPDL